MAAFRAGRDQPADELPAREARRAQIRDAGNFEGLSSDLRESEAGEDLRKRLVIAIDGPAGAGKSTVARRVAALLGYQYVDSGAMYRALALLALERKMDFDDAAALGRLAAETDMRFESRESGNRLFLTGRDVTEAIRSPEVTRASSLVSVHAEVRRKLVECQRALGRAGGVVMEGRDIGTQVFPDADLKIFLDASPDARSERRLRDLASSLPVGQAEVAQQVTRDMQERDRRDQTRPVSPLIPAADAIQIDTTTLTAEEVVREILNCVEKTRT